MKTDRKNNRSTEGVHDNVIVHQPTGSSEENHSSLVEEAKNTAGTKDYKKLGGSHVVVLYMHYFKA